MRRLLSISRRIPKAVPIAALLLLGLFAVSCGSSSEDLAVGDPAPDFTLPTAGGGEATLSDYEGKQPVLLFFHMAMG